MTRKFALLIALYLFTTGLGFLISGVYFSRMIAFKETDPILINLSGMTHFFIGAGILVFHPNWKKGLEIAVNIFAFLFLLKGVFLIALPELTLQSGNNPAQIPQVMGVGFLLAGLILGYFAVRSKTSRKETT